MTAVSRRSVVKSCALLAAGVPVLASGDDYVPAVAGGPEPPTSPFGFDSTAEDVTRGLDLAGMTALVTGCNSGLGLETMRVLALRGAHVFGAARSRKKAEAACESVAGMTTPVVVELSDFDNIVSTADHVRSTGEAIDMLILNAGIMGLRELALSNGVERQFAVNHLGHFLLTEHLLPSLREARAGRVVVVSSAGHRWAPAEGIQFDNLDGSNGYDPFVAYGQSKLANGLFSRELARRLSQSSRATSNSLHPGVIKTGIGRHGPPGSGAEGQRISYKTVPQGAATSCYLATHPELDGVSGYYFADCNAALPNAQMMDDAMAKKLWQASETLTREYRL
ncbi:MAG: SDR family oxidoreductase [Pseudomonadota bacterium]